MGQMLKIFYLQNAFHDNTVSFWETTLTKESSPRDQKRICTLLIIKKYTYSVPQAYFPGGFHGSGS